MAESGDTTVAWLARAIRPIREGLLLYSSVGWCFRSVLGVVFFGGLRRYIWVRAGVQSGDVDDTDWRRILSLGGNIHSHAKTSYIGIDFGGVSTTERSEFQLWGC